MGQPLSPISAQFDRMTELANGSRDLARGQSAATAGMRNATTQWIDGNFTESSNFARALYGLTGRFEDYQNKFGGTLNYNAGFVDAMGRQFSQLNTDRADAFTALDRPGDRAGGAQLRDMLDTTNRGIVALPPAAPGEAAPPTPIHDNTTDTDRDVAGTRFQVDPSRLTPVDQLGAIPAARPIANLPQPAQDPGPAQGN